MSNVASMQKEIKDLKKRLAQYERMYEKQVNPPVSITHVNYKSKFEAAQAELSKFKKIIGGIYRKMP